ncbi:hypothetical protein J2R76_003926 [Bradyrhizobium sp. USDA 4532]|uniref:hypothetical protein n=1 Tax=unclassified Bradyrhizobium TaxID=2631580 RepID=UPI0020A1B0BD|nr:MULTISPECIES: hypothetical protein [unclassified Bradyrhizobium]MCP1835586.1 hypothetical protein [Bradyrhizobium sp. USDA 4545]MCP1920335.1 hypothetical protein [Bradyrhizobium sp. USDA 4532]
MLLADFDSQDEMGSIVRTDLASASPCWRDNGLVIRRYALLLRRAARRKLELPFQMRGPASMEGQLTGSQHQRMLRYFPLSVDNTVMFAEGYKREEIGK